MNLTKSINKIALLFVVGIMMLSTIWFAFANPDPVAVAAGGINITNSTHKLTGHPGNISVLAGNITKVTMNGYSQTQSWAGVVGKIKANLTLGDASSKKLYNWNDASPKGEIYAIASGSTPHWTNSSLTCYNLSAYGSALNTLYGIGSTDADRANATFSTATGHTLFYAGPVRFALNACPSTQLFATGGAANAEFTEVLLRDSVAAKPIFVSLLANPVANQGYNGKTYDFEMLVGEDGHGNGATSAYNFYVELQ